MRKYLVLAIIIASLMLVYVVNLYLDLPKETPVDKNPTTQIPTKEIQPDPNETTSTEPPSRTTFPTTTPTVEPAPTITAPTTDLSSQAMVDSVEVFILESFPPQYIANIKGNFRNGCETLGELGQSISGTQVNLNITVLTEGDMCTQALVPFEVNFPINATNLTKGTYTLQANNQSTTFYVQ